MRVTLFTPETANRMLPELEPRLRALVAMRRELRRIETRMGVLAVALAGATPANPDAAESRELAGRRDALAARMRAGLEAIHARGPVVKDLDVGLLDFYSLAGDRMIFLCWKLGEPEITHWHPLDGGYSTRRPLDRSPLEE